MRRHDWPARLAATIAAGQTRDFRYGEHDCCLFAADCIAAVLGDDPAAAWRGRYATEAQGLAVAGVRTLLGLPRKIGLPRVDPAHALRGDIALAHGLRRLNDRVRRPMLLVVDGAWLRGPAGVSAERGFALRAWRVD